MIDEGRRGFFRKFVMTGAALAASAGVAAPRKAAASPGPGIKGVCLRVPHLELGEAFAEQMKERAPGSWSVHTLEGSVTDFYFETRSIYEELKGKETNTFVGVADPATFAVVREAISDSGGSFHYTMYEGPDRVSFSVRL